MMPVTVSVQEPTRFEVEATGKITGAECFRTLETILHDPHFARGATVLVVAHDITGAPAADELRSLATAMIPLKKGGLVGFAIVTQPGFVYGVARMFSALTELVGVSVDVFQDECEAHARLHDLSTRAA
jgi:hypothetical protein